ncbi:hypothetical protein [Loigolactobacillus backii]|uniref:hypothetical protein n=1 Tax=Loigolactobacillus backii TaxID=375175 RepID=UPI0007F12A4F|nr:hypothetical protein [Loigolactobacillus backii]ANK59805.1 hypothetical protein AYR52_05750 [Loigolactobacillus backii]
MKAIYLYDTTSREFQGSKLVDDDYVAATGETEIKPTDGLYEPITWDGAKWNGTDQAVWQAAQQAKYKAYIKEHPEDAPQPTAEQQQLAELIKNNAQQSTLNAQLIKQVAALKEASTTHTDTTQEVK